MAPFTRAQSHIFTFDARKAEHEGMVGLEEAFQYLISPGFQLKSWGVCLQKFFQFILIIEEEPKLTKFVRNRSLK